MPTGRRPTGVTILAVLQILAGLLYLVSGLSVSMVGGYVGGIFDALGGVMGIVLVIFGLVEIVVALGYLTGKGWARLLGLVLAGLGIIEGLASLPTGIIAIAIDGVAIYYLTRPNIVDWFQGRALVQ